MLQRAFDRGYVLAGVALVAYAWLCTPHIVGNDNAEFSTLAVTGGIAHPSGYPLYTLFLRATSWLPGSTPAHTAALATTLIAAGSVLALHAACRAWGARPLAASVATLVFASAGLMVREHTEAEVFPLNDLVVAVVLWLAAADGPLRGGWRASVLGLVAGLGLCNNLTCALVAPVGLLGVVRGVRESRLVVALPGAVIGLALGLLPYLYLFVAPINIMSWRHPSSFGDLVDIVTRKQYGGALGFSGVDKKFEIGNQLLELVVTLGRAWRWALLPVGLGMLGYRVARPAGETRAGWIALAACFVVAGPLLVMRFDIEPRGMGLYVVHRFHILPILFLAIPIASGLDVVGGMLANRLSRAPSPIAAHALSLLVFVALMVTSLPELARFHSPAMENGIRGMLAAFPKHTVVFTTTDEFDVGLHYEQMARGERPDVIVFRPVAIGATWYAEIVRDMGFDPGDPQTKTEIAETVLAMGRPLFVDRSQREILRELPSYPFGQLERVLPRGSQAPSLEEIVEINKQLYASFDLDYPHPTNDDEYAMVGHVRLAATWKRLGSVLLQQGKQAAAEDCFAIARQLSPRDD